MLFYDIQQTSTRHAAAVPPSLTQFPRPVQGVITDLDGVIFKDGKLIPHAAAFVHHCKTLGLPLVALTNHAGSSAAFVAQKLRNLGLEWKDQDVLTSIELTCMYLLARYPGARCHVLGSPDLQRAIDRILPPPEEADQIPDLVVVGYTTEHDALTLQRAARYVMNDARLIATNPDRLLPGLGAPQFEVGPVIAYLEAATRQRAEVIGKPSGFALLAACDRIGTEAAHTLMIGDTLETDIQGARNAGMMSALVLTGNTDREMARREKFQADVVVETLAQLQSLIAQLPYRSTLKIDPSGLFGTVDTSEIRETGD